MKYILFQLGLRGNRVLCEHSHFGRARNTHAQLCTSAVLKFYYGIVRRVCKYDNACVHSETFHFLTDES